MKLSFNQACTLHNSNLENDLLLCEQAGFDAIELRIDKLREYLNSHSVEDLNDYFLRSHIKPYSINGVYVYADFRSAADTEGRSSALLDDVKFACETAHAIGCDKMVMVPPVFSEEENKTYDDPWDKILEDNTRIFSYMADYVLPYNMNIGIEIVGASRSSIRTVEQCNMVIDAVSKPNLGYTIDSYNLYLHKKTNEFSDIKLAYPEKIFIVHINGGEASPQGVFLQKYRTFADRGVLDVDDYLRNLSKMDYCGYVSIEFFREDCWAMSAHDVINKCYETTKEVLARNDLLT